MDPATSDMKEWILDIPGQLYGLKDHNGDAVDISYSGANIQLPEVKQS